MVAGAIGYSALPREFFPIEDRNIVIVRVQAPEGTSFPYMDARMAELEGTLMDAVPERKALLTRVASGSGGTAAAANTGMFMVALEPKEERQRSQQEIVDVIRRELADVTAFTAVPVQPPTVGRGFSSPLQFVLLHPDFDTLAAALPGFVAAMSDLGGLSSVNADLKLNRPELRLVVDRERTKTARGFRAVGWQIAFVEARSLSHSYPDRFEGDDLYYGRYVFTVGLERFAASAVFKVFVPAFVIVLYFSFSSSHCPSTASPTATPGSFFDPVPYQVSSIFTE